MLAGSVVSARATTVGDIVGRVSLWKYRNLIVNCLSTRTGDNRTLGRPQHDLCARRIHGIMRDYGLNTSYDPFVYRRWRRYEYCWNIVGVKPGVTRPQEIYVIGAHYDSFNSPGADDNASGVAGMLEAARALAPYKFRSTIVFVAFDKEEMAHAGSRHFVATHYPPSIRGMVALDMLSWNAPGLWNYSACYCRRPLSDLTRYALEGAVRSYGDGLRFNYYGRQDQGDHEPFETAGIPACCFAEIGDFTNPFRHKRGDASDAPGYLDYAYAVKLVRSIVGWAATSAQLVHSP